MSRQLPIIRFMMICAVVLLVAACGAQGTSPTVTSSPTPQQTSEPTPDSDNDPVLLFETADVISKDGNVWLVTVYEEGENGAFIQAVQITISEDTELQNSQGEAIAAEAVDVGDQVEVWYTGVMLESYPGQTTATKLIVLDDEQTVPEGLMSRSEAVAAALELVSPESWLWAVKSVELEDEYTEFIDNGYWRIELVEPEAIDEPVAVHVDGSTAQADIIVAENSRIRLFSPLPGTEVGPTFTVEGVAQIFEATINWELEDGHYILAEDFETADIGAPSWGRFQFDVTYDFASQPDITLILLEYSMKDGSRVHELFVPLKAPEELVDYGSEE